MTQPWLEDELVVLATLDAPLTQLPLTLEELANAPWILRNPGLGTREVLEQLLLGHMPQF